MSDDAIKVVVPSALLDAIAKMRTQLPAAAQRGAYAAGEALRQHMTSQYLSGQRLKVQTGKLRGGWTTQAIPGGAILGTRTEYAPVLNYGFEGVVQVREYYRRNTPRRGVTAKGRPESKRSYRARVKEVRETQFMQRHNKEVSTFYARVRAHPRNVHVVARRYVEDTMTFGLPVALAAFNERVARIVKP